jgi:hypothetical protein
MSSRAAKSHTALVTLHSSVVVLISVTLQPNDKEKRDIEQDLYTIDGHTCPHARRYSQGRRQPPSGASVGSSPGLETQRLAMG